MLGPEHVWGARNRAAALGVSALVLLVIALIDWWTKPYVSLGFLYLFPIMLAAAFLPRGVIVFLGVICAVLAELFSSLAHSSTRFALEALALSGCGLFTSELFRNRRIIIAAQEQFRALVETSPAAIVIVDSQGHIELANQAATQLMAPRDGKLIGCPVAAFLPELHHALRWEQAPQFRTSMQCLGHCGNGETFLAEVWFSTYSEGNNPKLAAIIADITEDTQSGADGAAGDESGIPLNSREQDVLRYLIQGLTNKEIGGKMDLSESVIKNTLQLLFTKTGVRTRGQLVRVALERYRNLL